MPGCVVKPGYQAFGHEGTDLLFREISDCNDLFPDKRFWRIERGDLGARFEHADVATKIDLQFIGRLSRFRKGLGGDYAPNTKLDLHEIRPIDVFSLLHYSGEFSNIHVGTTAVLKHSINDACCSFVPENATTYAGAAHAAVVEVDVETGAVTVDRYAVVHDSGRSSIGRW